MFILSLTYTAPLSEVDAHVEPHLAWVAGGYDSGTFLASGRKEPRTGGVILAQGERSQLEAFVATDPFVLADVADYEITQVHLSRTVPGLEGLKG
ncbi:MAG: YciI family protein [Devosia indica]